MPSPASALSEALARGVELFREISASQHHLRQLAYNRRSGIGIREDDPNVADNLAAYDDSEYDPQFDYVPEDPETWTDDPSLMPSGYNTGADNNLPAIAYAMAAGMPVTAWGPAKKNPLIAGMAAKAARQFEQRSHALMAAYAAGTITLAAAFAGIQASYAQQSTNAFTAGQRALGDLSGMTDADAAALTAMMEEDGDGISALQAATEGAVGGGLLAGLLGGGGGGGVMGAFNDLQNLQQAQQVWDKVAGMVGASGKAVENYQSAGEAAALDSLPDQAVMVWWTLGEADHCQDCIALSDASPMLLSVLDEQGLFPGSGHTACGDHCYCTFEYDIPAEVCGDGLAGEDPSMSMIESADGTKFNVWVQEAASCDLPIDLSSMNQDGEYDVIDNADAFTWDQDVSEGISGDLAASEQLASAAAHGNAIMSQVEATMRTLMPEAADSMKLAHFANDTTDFEAVWHETATQVWFDAGVVSKGPTALEPEFVLKSMHQMSSYADKAGKDLVVNGKTAGPGMKKWLDTLGASHATTGEKAAAIHVSFPGAWTMPEKLPEILPAAKMLPQVAALAPPGTTDGLTKLSADLKELGGSAPKALFQAPDGTRYLAKYGPQAEVEAASSRLFADMGMRVPQARLVGPEETIQGWIPGAHRLDVTSETEMHGEAVFKTLTPDQAVELTRQSVLDFALANADATAYQYVIDGEGQLWGIDKAYGYQGLSLIKPDKNWWTEVNGLYPVIFGGAMEKPAESGILSLVRPGDLQQAIADFHRIPPEEIVARSRAALESLPKFSEYYNPETTVAEMEAYLREQIAAVDSAYEGMFVDAVAALGDQAPADWQAWAKDGGSFSGENRPLVRDIGKALSTPIDTTVPKPYELTMESPNAKGELGGVDAKSTYTADDGSRWMFKPEHSEEYSNKFLPPSTTTVIDQAAAARPEVIANRLGDYLGVNVAPVEAFTQTAGAPGAKAEAGTIQRLVPGVSNFGTTAADLSAPQMRELAKQQVLDWLVGNDDANPGNFLKLGDNLLGIDKAHAFWDLPSQSVHNYEVKNAFHIGSKLWSQAATDALAAISPDDIAKMLGRIEAVNDAAYLHAVAPAIDSVAKYGKTLVDGHRVALPREDIEAMVLKRKQDMTADFSAYYKTKIEYALSDATKGAAHLDALPPDWAEFMKRGGFTPELPVSKAEAAAKVLEPIGPPIPGDPDLLKEGLKPGKDAQMYLVGDNPVPINAPLAAWSGYVPPEPALPPLKATHTEIAAAKADAEAVKHNVAGFIGGQYDYLVSASKQDTETLVTAGHLYEKVGGLHVVARNADAMQAIKDYLDVSGHTTEDDAFWHILGFSNEDLAKFDHYNEIKTGYALKGGVTIVEPDGRVWIYEPKNHFAGYTHTWSKGGVDTGESVAQTAVRETREELGFSVELDGYLGDYVNADGTALSRMYVGHRTGGGPLMGDLHETYKVKLVTPDQAAKMLNRYGKPDLRDQQILADIGKATHAVPGDTHLVLPHDDLHEFGQKVMPLKPDIAVPSAPAISHHEPDLFSTGTPAQVVEQSHAAAFGYDGGAVKGAQDLLTIPPSATFKFSTTTWAGGVGETQKMYWSREVSANGSTRLFWANAKVQLANPVTRLNVHVAQLLKMADMAAADPTIAVLRINDKLLDQIPKLREMLIEAGASKPFADTALTDISREDLGKLAARIRGGAAEKVDALIPTAPLVPKAVAYTESLNVNGELVGNMLKAHVAEETAAEGPWVATKVTWQLGDGSTVETRYAIDHPLGKPAVMRIYLPDIAGEKQVAVAAAQMARLQELAAAEGVAKIRVLSAADWSAPIKDFLGKLAGEPDELGNAYTIDAKQLDKVKQELLGLDPTLSAGMHVPLPPALEAPAAVEQVAFATKYGVSAEDTVSLATKGPQQDAYGAAFHQVWHDSQTNGLFTWHETETDAGTALTWDKAIASTTGMVIRQLKDFGDLAELNDYGSLEVPTHVLGKVQGFRALLMDHGGTEYAWGVGLDKPALIGLRDKIAESFDTIPHAEPHWAPAGDLNAYLSIDPVAFKAEKAAVGLGNFGEGSGWSAASFKDSSGMIKDMGPGVFVEIITSTDAAATDIAESQLQIIRHAVNETSTAAPLWITGGVDPDVKQLLLSAGAEPKAGMLVLDKKAWPVIEASLTKAPEVVEAPVVLASANVRAVVATKAAADKVGLLALAENTKEISVAASYGQNMKLTTYGGDGAIRWRRLGNTLEVHDVAAADNQAVMAHILRMAQTVDETPKIEAFRFTTSGLESADPNIVALLKGAGGKEYPGGIRLSREQTLALRDTILTDVKATAVEPVEKAVQVLIPKYDLDPEAQGWKFAFTSEVKAQKFVKDSWQLYENAPVEVTYRNMQTEILWSRISGKASLIDQQNAATREFLHMADMLATNPKLFDIRFQQLDKLPKGFRQFLEDSGATSEKGGTELALVREKVLALRDQLWNELGMDHVEQTAFAAPLKSAAEDIFTQAGTSKDEVAGIKVGVNYSDGTGLDKHVVLDVGSTGGSVGVWWSNDVLFIGGGTKLDTAGEQLAAIAAALGELTPDAASVSFGFTAASHVQGFLVDHYGMTGWDMPVDQAKKLLADLKDGGVLPEVTTHAEEVLPKLSAQIGYNPEHLAQFISAPQFSEDLAPKLEADIYWGGTEANLTAHSFGPAGAAGWAIDAVTQSAGIDHATATVYSLMAMDNAMKDLTDLAVLDIPSSLLWPDLQAALISEGAVTKSAGAVIEMHKDALHGFVLKVEADTGVHAPLMGSALSTLADTKELDLPSNLLYQPDLYGLLGHQTTSGLIGASDSIIHVGAPSMAEISLVDMTNLPQAVHLDVVLLGQMDIYDTALAQTPLKAAMPALFAGLNKVQADGGSVGLMLSQKFMDGPGGNDIADLLKVYGAGPGAGGEMFLKHDDAMKLLDAIKTDSGLAAALKEAAPLPGAALPTLDVIKHTAGDVANVGDAVEAPLYSAAYKASSGEIAMSVYQANNGVTELMDLTGPAGALVSEAALQEVALADIWHDSSYLTGIGGLDTAVNRTYKATWLQAAGPKVTALFVKAGVTADAAGDISISNSILQKIGKLIEDGKIPEDAKAADAVVVAAVHAGTKELADAVKAVLGTESYAPGGKQFDNGVISSVHLVYAKKSVYHLSELTGVLPAEQKDLQYAAAALAHLHYLSGSTYPLVADTKWVDAAGLRVKALMLAAGGKETAEGVAMSKDAIHTLAVQIEAGKFSVVSGAATPGHVFSTLGIDAEAVKSYTLSEGYAGWNAAYMMSYLTDSSGTKNLGIQWKELKTAISLDKFQYGAWHLGDEQAMAVIRQMVQKAADQGLGFNITGKASAVAEYKLSDMMKALGYKPDATGRFALKAPEAKALRAKIEGEISGRVPKNIPDVAPSPVPKPKPIHAAAAMAQPVVAGAAPAIVPMAAPTIAGKYGWEKGSADHLTATATTTMVTTNKAGNVYLTTLGQYGGDGSVKWAEETQGAAKVLRIRSLGGVASTDALDGSHALAAMIQEILPDHLNANSAFDRVFIDKKALTFVPQFEQMLSDSGWKGTADYYVLKRSDFLTFSTYLKDDTAPWLTSAAIPAVTAAVPVSTAQAVAATVAHAATQAATAAAQATAAVSGSVTIPALSALKPSFLYAFDKSSVDEAYGKMVLEDMGTSGADASHLAHDYRFTTPGGFSAEWSVSPSGKAIGLNAITVPAGASQDQSFAAMRKLVDEIQARPTVETWFVKPEVYDSVPGLRQLLNDAGANETDFPKMGHAILLKSADAPKVSQALATDTMTGLKVSVGSASEYLEYNGQMAEGAIMSVPDVKGDKVGWLIGGKPVQMQVHVEDNAAHWVDIAAGDKSNWGAAVAAQLSWFSDQGLDSAVIDQAVLLRIPKLANFLVASGARAQADGSVILNSKAIATAAKLAAKNVLPEALGGAKMAYSVVDEMAAKLPSVIEAAQSEVISKAGLMEATRFTFSSGATGEMAWTKSPVNIYWKAVSQSTDMTVGEKRAAAVAQLRTMLQSVYADAGINRLDVDGTVAAMFPGLKDVLSKYGATLERNPDGTSYLSLTRAKATKLRGDLEKELGASLGGSGSTYIDQQAALIVWPNADTLKVDQADARSLGGQTRKMTLTDEKGDLWLFKPGASGRGAAVDKSVSELAQKLGLAVPPTREYAITVNGETVRGSLQKMVPGVKSVAHLSDLTPGQMAEVMQHSVLDWLTANDDGHVGQWLIGPDGHVWGIDKTRSWVSFHGAQDVLDRTSMGNGGGQPLIFKFFSQAVGNPKLLENIHPSTFTSILRKVDNLDTAEFKTIVADAATLSEQTRYARDPAKFLADMVERKNSTAADFDRFVSKQIKDAMASNPAAVPKEWKDWLAKGGHFDLSSTPKDLWNAHRDELDTRWGTWSPSDFSAKRDSTHFAPVKRILSSFYGGGVSAPQGATKKGWGGEFLRAKLIAEGHGDLATEWESLQQWGLLHVMSGDAAPGGSADLWRKYWDPEKGTFRVARTAYHSNLDTDPAKYVDYYTKNGFRSLLSSSIGQITHIGAPSGSSIIIWAEVPYEQAWSTYVMGMGLGGESELVMADLRMDQVFAITKDRDPIPWSQVMGYSGPLVK